MKASMIQATAVLTKDLRIAVNRGHRYLFCYSYHDTSKGWKKNAEICPWLLECKPASTTMHDGSWKILKIVAHHTCSDDDSTRKRNYHLKALEDASKVLQTFVP